MNLILDNKSKARNYLIHEKTPYGSNIANKIVTLKSFSTDYGGSHIHFMNATSNGTGIVTLQMDIFLNNAYTSAPNQYVIFIPAGEENIGHEAYYFFHNNFKMQSQFNYYVPSYGIWHNIIYTINMSTKTMGIILDGVVFNNASNYTGFGTLTSNMNLVIGVASYGFGALYQYKNIFYTNQNGNTIRLL